MSFKFSPNGYAFDDRFDKHLIYSSLSAEELATILTKI